MRAIIPTLGTVDRGVVASRQVRFGWMSISAFWICGSLPGRRSRSAVGKGLVSQEQSILYFKEGEAANRKDYYELDV